MSFAELKKNSGNVEDLTKALEEENKKKDYSDDRFWFPQLDDDGSGTAEIRFLPNPEGEKRKFIKKYSYSFERYPGTRKGPWYIEDSPTTIDKPDPVAEYNSKVWNDTNRDKEERENDARKRKRTTSYVSNIYVVSDPSNPENEGKVFLYRYGKKIFDKIKDCIEPEFKDKEAFDPFDFWKGANFRLRIRKVAGFNNYDKSEFMQPAPLLDGDDKKLKKVYDSLYSLEELISPDVFKSYAELQAILFRVVPEAAKEAGVSIPVAEPTSSPATASAPKAADPEDDNEDDYVAELQRLAEQSEEDSD